MWTPGIFPLIAVVVGSIAELCIFLSTRNSKVQGE